MISPSGVLDLLLVELTFISPTSFIGVSMSYAKQGSGVKFSLSVSKISDKVFKVILCCKGFQGDLWCKRGL